MKKKAYSVVLFVAAALMLLPPDVFALNQYGPSSSTAEFQNTTYSVISNTSDVDIVESYFKVYYTTPGTKNVTIQHANHCSAGVIRYDGEVAAAGATGANHTRYRIYRTQIDTVAKTEVQSGAPTDNEYGVIDRDATCNNRTLTVNLGAASYSPYIGRYVAIVRASKVANGTSGQNVYRVYAPGAIVGLVGKIDAADSGIEIIGNSTFAGGGGVGYSYLRFRFAPDCTFTSPGWQRIRVYDPDNNVAGIQPSAMWFRVYDQTAGRYLNAGEYQNPNNVNGNASGWRPSNVSNGYASIRTYLRPGHRYEWRFFNVYDNNTLQIEQPFDSIYYNIPCSGWDAAASTTMTVNGVIRTNGTASPYAVAPGTTVQWVHGMQNNGPLATDRDINWDIRRVVDSTWSTPSSGAWAAGRASGASTTRTTGAYTITAADAGRRICQRIEIDPGGVNPSGNSTGAESSPLRCVQVDNPWSLSPSASVSPSTAVVGATINVTGSVQNTTPRDAGTHNWRIARIDFAPGTTPNPAALSQGSGDICATVINESSCDATFQTYSQSFPPSATRTDTVSYPIPGTAAVGTSVCFVTYVENPTNATTDDTDWRFSSYACTKVGKVPTVHIWGNDLRVGSSSTVAGANKLSGIQGRTVTSGGLTYGSWGEYAAIAPSDVINFGSAGGLSGGNASSVAANWNRLTFANTPSFGSFAPTTSLGLLPDIQSYVSRFDPADVDVRTAGALTGWPTSPRRHIVVEAPGGGVIQILNNIVPGFAYTNVESMPQLIIIADEIQIRDNVQRIDAWLVARSITTCSNGPANLTISDCNSPLEINGPIIAEQLDLRRTAGADSVATLNDPAETINMPASTYIWARHYDEKNGQLKTVTTRELPPRY